MGEVDMVICIWAHGLSALHIIFLLHKITVKIVLPLLSLNDSYLIDVDFKKLFDFIRKSGQKKLMEYEFYFLSKIEMTQLC